MSGERENRTIAATPNAIARATASFSSVNQSGTWLAVGLKSQNSHKSATTPEIAGTTAAVARPASLLNKTPSCLRSLFLQNLCKQLARLRMYYGTLG
jgi:hypothetical protein